MRGERCAVGFVGLALVLLGWPQTAKSQFYVQSERSEAYVDLANIQGVQGLTPFDFSSRDEGQATLTLPFSFLYLGQSFSEFNISVNGNITFGENPGSYINEPIGDTSAPNNMIAAWWDDLILPDVSGFASYGVLGSAPNRIFIVEVRDWEAWPFNNIADGRYQIWLYEGASSRFEVRVEGALSASEDYDASTGWEGPGATLFGAFRPCATAAPYCGPAEYDTMRSVVLSVQRAEGPEILGSLGSFGRGALPGATAVGPIVVENQGTVDLPPTTAGVYLSLDTMLDASDIAVQNVAVPALLVNSGPTTLTTTITVPAGAAAGDYYLLVNLDEPDVIAEVVEDNNLLVSDQRFATAYDVAATSLDAPGNLNSGANFNVSAQFANLGVPFMGPVDYALYGSVDPLLDPQDTLLGGGTINFGGGLNEAAQLGGIITGLAPGEYFLIVRLDPGSVLTEYNVQNNALPSVDRFSVGPDLVPTAVFAQGGATPGQPLTFDIEITNEGAPYTGSVELRLVASTDPIYDAIDPVMGNVTVALGGQAVETVMATVTVPALPSASYFPIVLLDPQDAVDEVSEFNNIYTDDQPFAVGPDFGIGPITAPTQATGGQPFAVTTRIASTGAAYTGSVSYRLYLSPDQVFDPQDGLLGVYSVNFTGELSIDDTQMPLFPAGLPPVGSLRDRGG